MIVYFIFNYFLSNHLINSEMNDNVYRNLQNELNFNVDISDSDNLQISPKGKYLYYFNGINNVFISDAKCLLNSNCEFKKITATNIKNLISFDEYDELHFYYKQKLVKYDSKFDYEITFDSNYYTYSTIDLTNCVNKRACELKNSLLENFYLKNYYRSKFKLNRRNVYLYNINGDVTCLFRDKKFQF